ncbi:TetR/AcrR family transcriptional regulator C-terminal ligand-binding domain-containing protein [Nocardia jiangxiensis]|uniref:TetR/AcrR family transcriptional regulator C-terminal ligand-binding domain-containing protein n=1 Tax=Nocardia jiangxiensis TaxID=282685 RepID=A0ABW6SDU9_9NOCA
MATEASEPVRRRRYGAQLESALLEAGWAELVEVGYARLTMESIALRAQTSEAVLYRRWANKDQLVVAAIDHHRDANPIRTPDTGSVRGDLLAELTAESEALAGFFAIAAAAAFSGLLADTGRTPAQVRDEILAGRSLPPVRTIYRRAHDRGEVDLERIPAAVLAMPFDLVRHDMLMELEPLRPERIRAIVDELFLPLVQNFEAGRNTHVDRTGPEGDSRRPETAHRRTVQPQTVNSLTFSESAAADPVPTTERSLELFRSILSAQRKAAETWIRTRDLTFEQAMVLGYLQQRPGAIQREIARMSHTTPANVSLLLRGLERRGLVERRTEGGNERSKCVYATSAGIELIAGLDAAMAEVDEAIFAPLDDAERIGLQRHLDKINAQLPGTPEPRE